jgi:hypothetical protein
MGSGGNMKTLGVFAVIAIALIAGVAFLKAQKKSPQQTEFKTTDEMMTFLASEAVKDAEKENQIKLDYSPQSIEKVEAVLSKIHEQYTKDKSSIAVNGLSMAYGAYIGETIKRSVPGSKWERDHPVAGEKSYPIHWKGGESFPCGWCFKRITNGPEDNVWHKYQMLKEQRG